MQRSMDNKTSQIWTEISIITEPRYEKTVFGYAKTKTQISFRYMDSTIPLLPKSEI